MSKLTDALNRCLYWIERYDPIYSAELLPRLKHPVIADVVQRYMLGEEILELYNWTNGTTRDLKAIISYRPSITPFYQCLEIADFLSCDPNDGGARYKGQLLFPFACSQEGEHCVIIGQKNSLVVFNESEVSCQPTELYDSITTMFISLAVNFETEGYFVSSKGEDEGFIIENENMVAETLRKENPIVLRNTLEEIERLALLSKEEIDSGLDELYYGIFCTAYRYRDARFFDPWREILAKSDYREGSWLRDTFDRLIASISR